MLEFAIGNRVAFQAWKRRLGFDPLELEDALDHRRSSPAFPVGTDACLSEMRRRAKAREAATSASAAESAERGRGELRHQTTARSRAARSRFVPRSLRRRPRPRRTRPAPARCRAASRPAARDGCAAEVTPPERLQQAGAERGAASSWGAPPLRQSRRDGARDIRKGDEKRRRQDRRPGLDGRDPVRVEPRPER